MDLIALQIMWRELLFVDCHKFTFFAGYQYDIADIITKTPGVGVIQPKYNP